MLIQNRAIENVIFIVFPSLVLPGKAKGKPERLLPKHCMRKGCACSKQRCVYEATLLVVTMQGKRCALAVCRA